MLHLNKDGSPDLTLALKNEEIIWKVLILDVKSRSILSSVLRVNDLLRCGITIHPLINSKKSSLPDVPVIYFIEPTIENILIIIEDLNNNLYDDFYINFTSSLNRELLEEFAKRVSKIGKAYKIKQIYDQYLNFIVTEPNLFSLDNSLIFSKFNNPSTTEDEIHNIANSISDGLLATIITLGNIPIIRCQRNGPAELIANQLDSKLRDYLINSKNLINQSIQQRSVLILLDRNIDLASMFSHSWIYQCMVSDVFELKRNTIKIEKNEDDNKTTNSFKNYDIDPKDFFWNKNSQLPFPDAVENADFELQLYKKDAQDLTNKTGITSLSDIDPNSKKNDTSQIQQAVDALPELTSRKTTLDMHMDVLASLLKELEAKSLDKFFEIEQNYNDPKIQQQFLEILKNDSKKDNSIDKFRTFLILNLLCDNLSSHFINQCKEIFISKYSNINLNAFNYILKFKQILNLSKNISLNDPSSQNKNSSNLIDSNNSALFNGLSSKLYGLTEGRITEGLSSLATGLKKLLPEKKNLPITNVVEAIMDPNNASNNSIQLTDDYLYLDPKSRGGHSKPPKRQLYQESLVFVVGGGNYLEYQNLTEWSNQPNRSPKKIIYGSTDIITAKEFLEEISTLGSLENQ